MKGHSGAPPDTGGKLFIFISFRAALFPYRIRPSEISRFLPSSKRTYYRVPRGGHRMRAHTYATVLPGG